MRNGITVRDVMNREFLGVSESDTLADAAELMRDEAAEEVVVLRGSEPLGLVSAQTAMAALLDDTAQTPVAAVMEPPVATLEPTASLADATQLLVSRGRSQLLVVTGDEVLGVLTDRDVLAAHESVETAGSTSQPEEPLAVTEQTEAATVESSTQSICEVCGALAPELSERNGQQVCVDCRAY